MVTRFSLRLYLLAIVMLSGLGALGARLWVIQVKQHHIYLENVPGSSTVTQRVPGVRGQIRDRNGVVLATNRAIAEVALDLVDVEKEFRRLRTADAVPMFEYRVNGRIRTEPDIVKIVEEEVLKPLDQMGMTLNINKRHLRVHYRSKKDVLPYRNRQELTFEEYAAFAEFNLNLPGVNVSVRPVREYPYGSLACHILGYVREAEDTIPDEDKGKYRYYVGDDFGIAGVEKTMNSNLKGKPGVRTWLKNEKGALVRESDFQEPVQGDDVYLTIDARMQYLVESILREAGVGRAAAVVMDPASSEILAMASVPSYNPNRFIPGISKREWDAYTSNKTKPFQNRVLSASPPGSTFKIVTALAGALANKNRSRLQCDGGHGFGDAWMKCWIASKSGAHGWLDVSHSIKTSCNDFYYQYGNLAGIQKILTVGGLLGLGAPYRIDLEDQQPGLLPTPQWLRGVQRRRWGDADTAQVSIGQGATMATPLQMAMVTTVIANRGLCYKPRLISKVRSAIGEESMRGIELQCDLTREGIAVEQIEEIRQGMWMVVNDYGGTARRAFSPTHPTAGKTGSATVPPILIDGELREDTHAWFISFAPFDEPKVSVCVRVEGGKAGGKVAAPIAAEIIARVMAIDAGYQVRIGKVPESAGDLGFTEEVTFGGAGGDFDDEGVEVAMPLEGAIPVPFVEAPGSEASSSSPAQPRIEPEGGDSPE